MWGTVLAEQMARPGKGTSVWLWEFHEDKAGHLSAKRAHPHLPGLNLSKAIHVTANIEEAVRGASYIVIAVPSTHVRKTARMIRRGLDGPPPCVVNASKGIEPGTLRTMGQVLEQEIPGARAVYTLSGPSFAREVFRGVRTKLVLAGPKSAAMPWLSRRLNGGVLRVEATQDRVGVELGGALKNVMAIGCGILDGLDGGSNTKAALIIQGMGEMARIVKALGGKPETIYGLAGLGDLIATGTSVESRNRFLGEKLGGGRGLRQALREIPTVVEGIETVHSALVLARRLGLKAPLLSAIWRVVHAGAAPGEVVKALGF